MASEHARPDIPAHQYTAWASALLRPTLERCRDVIERAVNEREEVGDDTVFGELENRVCRTLGEGIYDYLSCIWDEEDRRDSPDGVPAWERDMFFWPGYTRWATREEPGTRQDVSRTSVAPAASGHIEAIRASIRDARYGVGFTLTSDGQRAEHEHFPLAIWYTLLYSRRFNDYFFDGFHQWFKLNPGMVIRPRPAEGASETAHEVPLLGVLIRCLPHAPADRERLFGCGVLPIDLPDEAPLTMLDAMTRSINGDAVLSSGLTGEVELAWPERNSDNDGLPYLFPPFRVPARHADDPSRAVSAKEIRHASPHAADELQRVELANRFVFSLILHSIFMGGVCLPRWAHLSATDCDKRRYALREYVENHLEGLRRFDQFAGLADAVADGLKLFLPDGNLLPLDYLERRYTHYYVMPLQKAVKFEWRYGATGDDIGTINLYCNRPIPPTALEAIKICAEEVYLQLRFVEAANEALRGGERQQQASFAHNMAGITQGLLYSNELMNLSSYVRLTLWHLSVTVTDVYSGRKFDPSRQLHSIGELNLPSENCRLLNELADFGLCHGYLRAQSRPTPRRFGLDQPCDDPAVMQERKAQFRLADLVCRTVVQELDKQNDYVVTDPRFAQWLRERLGFTPEPPGTPLPGWAGAMGFALFFHHALWQAVFHALQAYVKDPFLNRESRKPYLTLSVETDGVSIRNRSAWANSAWQRSKREQREKMFVEYLTIQQDENCWPRFRLEAPKPDHTVPTGEYWYVTRVRVTHAESPSTARKPAQSRQQMS